MTVKERRQHEVAAGNCGHCFQPRGRYKFLCDECARKHRERQRGTPRKVADDATRRRHVERDKLLAYLKRVRGL
jgi:hypothetical protein